MCSPFHSWFHQLHQPLRVMRRDTACNSPPPHQKKAQNMLIGSNRFFSLNKQWLVILLHLHASFDHYLILQDIFFSLGWTKPKAITTKSKFLFRQVPASQTKLCRQNMCTNQIYTEWPKGILPQNLPTQNDLMNMFHPVLQLPQQFATIRGALLLMHFLLHP